MVAALEAGRLAAAARAGGVLPAREAAGQVPGDFTGGSMDALTTAVAGNAPALERLYSVEEVAGLWGFSVWWVRTRAKQGAFGDLVDFDGDVRLRESGLRAYQESKARMPWVVPEERRKRGMRIRKTIGAAA